jgi:hypothetical protein
MPPAAGQEAWVPSRSEIEPFLVVVILFYS